MSFCSLCSGVLDARRLLDRGIKVGLGTGTYLRTSNETLQCTLRYTYHTRSPNSKFALNRVACIRPNGVLIKWGGGFCTFLPSFVTSHSCYASWVNFSNSPLQQDWCFNSYRVSQWNHCRIRSCLTILASWPCYRGQCQS